MNVFSIDDRLESIRAEKAKRFVTRDELMAILGCSVPTFYRHISLHGFPKGKKAPGGKLWDLLEVESYLSDWRKKGK